MESVLSDKIINQMASSLLDLAFKKGKLSESELICAKRRLESTDGKKSEQNADQCVMIEIKGDGAD